MRRHGSLPRAARVASFSGVLLLAPGFALGTAFGASCTNTRIMSFSTPNVVIDSAVQALTPVPHCNVYGRINPNRAGINGDGKIYNIGFNLRLPDTWNRRFLELGGGGTDGSIPTADPVSPATAGLAQLSAGYAITSNDGGHEDSSSAALAANPHLSSDQDDATGGTAHFGVDPQARLDYGYAAMAQNAEVAKAIIKYFYMNTPRYSYFKGCSNGGREAFMASQRFPDLFDGIAAMSPGFDLPRAAVAEAWNEQALLPLTTGAPTDPTTNPPEPYFGNTFTSTDLQTIATAVNAACDRLDGVADGMVNNWLACTNKRVLQQLTALCQSGGSCISPAQTTALKKIIGGPRNSKGQQLYAFDQYYSGPFSHGHAWWHRFNRIGPDYRAFPWDPGIATPSPVGGIGWQAWMLTLIPPLAPVNTALNLTLGGGALPMVFVTPPQVLPTTPAAGGDARASYVLNFDFDRDAPKIFAAKGPYTRSSIEFMAATSTDLSDFKRRGGKLVISHGTADGVFSPTDTARWYNALDEENHGNADRFVRLFIVPGMTHCGGGPSTSSYDDFAAVVNWVENGQAPDSILATAPPGSQFAGRTRPLCPYPEYAQYTGGSIELASSFVCKRYPNFTGHELDGYQ